MDNMIVLFQKIIMPLLSIGSATFLAYLNSKTERYKSAADELSEAQKELEKIKNKELESKFENIENSINNLRENINEVDKTSQEYKKAIIDAVSQIEILNETSLMCIESCLNLNIYSKKLTDALYVALYNSKNKQNELKQDERIFESNLNAIRQTYMTSILNFKNNRGGSNE